jgi:hypothetical protein
MEPQNLPNIQNVLIQEEIEEILMEEDLMKS